MLKQFLSSGRRRIYELWNRFYWWIKTRGFQRLPKQHNLIHNFDWDYLIILDACRADYFVATYTDFISLGELSLVYSSGRDTFEFVRNTFPLYYDLTYVSGAVPINSVIKHPINDSNKASIDKLWRLPNKIGRYYGGYVPKEHFKRIIDVWDHGWDGSLGTCPPERVTQSALKVIKHHKQRKVIIHYFQPHAPYIGEYKLLGYTGQKYGKDKGNPPDQKIWKNVGKDISITELRKAYVSNLRLVLKEVKCLLNNIESRKIVITSDHGELLGEDGRFAHHRIDHPKLRVIPWLVVTCISHFSSGGQPCLNTTA